MATINNIVFMEGEKGFRIISITALNELMAAGTTSDETLTLRAPGIFLGVTESVQGVAGASLMANVGMSITQVDLSQLVYGDFISQINIRRYNATGGNYFVGGSITLLMKGRG